MNYLTLQRPIAGSLREYYEKLIRRSATTNEHPLDMQSVL
jgi:hypothetical protein